MSYKRGTYDVPRISRHRLRILDKLGEGNFGLVSLVFPIIVLDMNRYKGILFLGYFKCLLILCFNNVFSFFFVKFLIFYLKSEVLFKFSHLSSPNPDYCSEHKLL